MTQDSTLLPFRAQIPLDPASSRPLGLPDWHRLRLLNNVAVGPRDRLYERLWRAGSSLVHRITAASRQLRLLDVVRRPRRVEVVDEGDLRGCRMWRRWELR
jgi:hypothetical protein